MRRSQPIVITHKVDNLDPTKTVHKLDIVSLDIFDTNKRTTAVKKELIATDTESAERDEVASPTELPKNFIYPPNPKWQDAGAAVEAQVHTSLEESLGNTAILPLYDSRRQFLHYPDDEVSSEEKMAKVARYAYTPTREQIMRTMHNGKFM